MEKEFEPFVRYGTEDERIEVSADEILKAIAEKRAVDIDYAVIEGDIGITGLGLDKDEQGNSIIASRIWVSHSSINGAVYFNFASFKDVAFFVENNFEQRVDFGASLGVFAYPPKKYISRIKQSEGAPQHNESCNSRWPALPFVYATFATSDPEASRHESHKVDFLRRPNSVSHLMSHNSILRSSKKL